MRRAECDVRCEQNRGAEERRQKKRGGGGRVLLLLLTLCKVTTGFLIKSV